MVTYYLVYTRDGWGGGMSEAEARANLRDHVGPAKAFILEIFRIAADTPAERRPRSTEFGVEYWPGSQERVEVWRVNGKQRTKLGG